MHSSQVTQKGVRTWLSDRNHIAQPCYPPFPTNDVWGGGNLSNQPQGCLLGAWPFTFFAYIIPLPQLYMLPLISLLFFPFPLTFTFKSSRPTVERHRCRTNKHTSKTDCIQPCNGSNHTIQQWEYVFSPPQTLGETNLFYSAVSDAPDSKAVARALYAGS